MVQKKEKRTGKRPAVPLPLVAVFVLAVLLPSTVLSFLALRAADREAVYVERSLEAALLAEVNLAANRISALLDALASDLKMEAAAIPLESGSMRIWSREVPAAAFPFLLKDGILTIPEGQGSPAEHEVFRSSFGGFLRGDAQIPVYDHLAGVYRKEMGAFSSREVSPTLLDTGEYGADVASVLPSPPALLEEPSPEKDAPAAPAPAPSFWPGLTQTLGKKASRPAVPDGIAMQQMQSIMTSDPAVREEVFQKAEEEGFALLQRNVAPQAGSVSGTDREERSRTVAKGKTFAELRMESSGGLLPRRTDRGLDLIYWLNRGNGDAAGFFLDTEAIRDMIAGAVPDLLTEVRVLAVLDDRGEPLVRPEIPALPDWRRPFVAREISPLLPGWEAGSWLVNPEFVSSRARFAVLAVWILTAVLFVVILAGGVSVIRMLSAEIRTARQKATFAASVSHELKTPLTSIRLFAEMLLSGRTRSEEKKNEYLRTMVSEAERLSRLVDNVLTFSGKGNGGQKLAMEPLDLAELAAGTADQLQPHLAGNGFSLSFMGQKRLPVTGDREALRQVLMNLLSNGEKYSGDRREITVECRAENGMAVIDILDRGIGVDPRHSEKIFQEFFREDDSLAAPKGGAGLGLSIARDIARRHGGDVLYAPRDGGGSIFSLLLPFDGTGENFRG